MPYDAAYTIYTSGSLDTIGELSGCCLPEAVTNDDYDGRINFRIVKILCAGCDYYIRVSANGDATGSYTLEVTRKNLVDYISLNQTEITLDHIGKVYELPVLSNTFTGVAGAEPLNTLVASTVPSYANEKKVVWTSFDRDVIKIDSGWYNGQRYQTLTVVGNGTAKLYAYDWNENGKRGECTVHAGGGWPVYAKPTIHSRESWGQEPLL